MKKFALALVLALPLAHSPAQAEQLNYANGFPPGSVPIQSAEEFAKYLKKIGGPDVKVFPMSLLTLKQTPQGISDHIVDLGFVSLSLFQAEFANSNLGATLNMQATLGGEPSATLEPAAAMNGALTEYILLHCPDCVAEFAAQHQVYLGGHSSPPYALECLQTVKTLQDIKGKKIRIPSGAWGRWAEAMGAVKVTMPNDEAFSAMSQGVVNCTAFAPADLLNLRLIDVAKSVTLGVPSGVYAGVGIANVNLGVWRELSLSDRKAFLKAAAYYSALDTYDYSRQSDEALDAARKKGIEIVDAGPSLLQATKKFVEGDTETISKEFSTKYHVNDVDKKISEIKDLIGKWRSLTQGVSSREDLQKLYYDNIYAKVDAETYGMK